ncbi:unnamed protein product [Diamesa hyperborea]
MNSNILRRGIATATLKQSAAGPSAVSGHEAGGYKLWKRLSFFVAIPAVALCMLNTYLKHQEDHETYVRPEFVKYEHLRIRNKRFPWGEGNKSLFHNPDVNALPDGYEEGSGHH